jgi:GAF domain-containing protein
MKRFFENLLKPRTSLSENEVQHWRERIVAIALLAAAALGAVAYGINLYLTVQNQNWIWAIIYTISYFMILIIAISPRLPYNVRSGALLVILYLLGLVSAFQYGSAGDARIWLMGFTILAGVFLGLTTGIIAAVASTATLLLFGIGVTNGWIPSPENTSIIDASNFTSWFSTAIPFLAIGVISILSIGVIVNGLNKSLIFGRQLTLEKDKDRENLERRSADLERRDTQIRTAAEITRAISGELDPDQLFSRVVNLIKERFNLYYVGIFLIDDSGLYAVLREGTGVEGSAMLEDGHNLPVGGSSMIGASISQRGARIALDVGVEAARFDNPYLPDTRSELALPIISGDLVLGALTVQSDQSEAFDEEDIIVLQGIADNLSTAIENARLFRQTELNLQEIQKLHQQYLGDVWAQVIENQGNLRYEFINPQLVDIPSDGTTQYTKIKKPIILHDQVIGNLVFETSKPRFDPGEEALIEAVASQAALALENARLVETTQRSAQQDRIVADLSSKVWASTNIDTILRTALSEMVQTLQATDGIIHFDLPDVGQGS